MKDLPKVLLRHQQCDRITARGYQDSRPPRDDACTHEILIFDLIEFPV
jgi:hypothetical protein